MPIDTFVFKNTGAYSSTEGISLFLSRETKTIRLENLLYLCEGFGIELKDFFDDKVFKNVEAKNWLKNPEDES